MTQVEILRKPRKKHSARSKKKVCPIVRCNSARRKHYENVSIENY